MRPSVTVGVDEYRESTQMLVDVVPMVGEAFADWSRGRDEVVLDDEQAHGSQHNVNHSGTNEIMDEGSAAWR